MSETQPVTTTPTRAERVESALQLLILLGMGGMAGAASFTHVHDLTVEHGQPSWFGWVNAVVVELTSVAAGLEIRRRRRTGQPVTVLCVVLVFAVLTRWPPRSPAPSRPCGVGSSPHCPRWAF